MQKEKEQSLAIFLGGRERMCFVKCVSHVCGGVWRGGVDEIALRNLEDLENVASHVMFH